MIVMLIVLVALGTIAGLTVISVQGGAAQMSAQRFSAIALYAAESGAAAAMSWVRDRHEGEKHLSLALSAPTPAIPGNGARPGEPGNLLSDDQQAWYEVTLLNNPGDPGGVGIDTDDIVVIQATGHGPGGALRRVEWAVRRDHASASPVLGLAGWRDLF